MVFFKSNRMIGELKKKKMKLENVIRLANILPYTYLQSKLYSSVNHLKDMNASNINEVSFNVWTTEC